MTSRTTVRRSSIVGLGLLGAVALAGTAQAQTLPTPGTPLTTVTGAVAPVVDPLTTPLNGTVDQVTAPVQQAVQQATQPGGTAPTPPTAPATPTGSQPKPVPGPSAPAQPAGGTAGQPAAQPPAASQPAAPAPAPAPATAPAAAASTGGYGVAAMPDSLVRKLNSLEQFSPGAGFASAANPMSLFGAPQVAPLDPAVTAELLPTPLAVRPAGAGLEQALPVRAAQDLPAVLVAIAFTAVAGAGAAQIAVLRRVASGTSTA